MLQTAGRLTLYGLISSLDADLRKMVQDTLLVGQRLEDILPSELLEKVAARADKDGISSPDEYYDYLDFGDSLSLLRKNIGNYILDLAMGMADAGFSKEARHEYQSYRPHFPRRSQGACAH